MKPAAIFPVLFVLLSARSHADEKSKNLAMKVLESRTLDGQECVPWHGKRKKEGAPLDPDMARFRVRSWEGDEQNFAGIVPLGGAVVWV